MSLWSSSWSRGTLNGTGMTTFRCNEGIRHDKQGGMEAQKTGKQGQTYLNTEESTHAEKHGLRLGGVDSHSYHFPLGCINPRWASRSDKANKTTSSAKSRDTILRPTNWTLSFPRLRLEILSMNIANRFGGKGGQDLLGACLTLSENTDRALIVVVQRPDGFLTAPVPITPTATSTEHPRETVFSMSSPMTPP